MATLNELWDKLWKNRQTNKESTVENQLSEDMEVKDLIAKLTSLVSERYKADVVVFAANTRDSEDSSVEKQGFLSSSSNDLPFLLDASNHVLERINEEHNSTILCGVLTEIEFILNVSTAAMGTRVQQAYLLRELGRKYDKLCEESKRLTRDNT